MNSYFYLLKKNLPKGTNMKISVIVTVFNECREYILECLNSLDKQTLKKEFFDIIIVDDNSTSEETKKALEEIKIENKQVKIITNKENKGPNESRKIGVQNATGEYILYIDSDDFLTRDALESLWIKAKSTKSDLVTALMYRYNGVSKSYNLSNRFYTYLPKNRSEKLKIVFSGDFSYSMCGSLIKKELLTDDIFHTTKRIWYEDLLTLPRIILKCKEIESINKHIYYYRWNSNSITSSLDESHIEGIFYAFRDWLHQVQKYNLEEELLPYIIYAISSLSNLWILRSLYKPRQTTSPIKLVKKISSELQALKITPIIGSHQGLKLLKYLESKNNFTEIELNHARIKFNLEKQEVTYNESSKLSIGLKPSELAKKLDGKIVFICQVDYHVKRATNYIKNLRNKYNNLVILDNSYVADNGNRKSDRHVIASLRSDEYIPVKDFPLNTDSLCTASLIIAFNDFNAGMRDALEYRYLYNKPSACIIEGINDFLRIDFDNPTPLPYRSCETVLLSGNYDRKFFLDRNTFIVGLTITEELIKNPVIFPTNKLAVLNSNFTYGSLEDKREYFISSAQEALNQLGWDWVITKHPADKGNYKNLPLSEKSLYALINECTVFISRFSTGIIEALAAGKPVIYYNCHQEKNDKFKNSLGAYEIANSKEELAQALTKVELDLIAKVDFRKRAEDFLKEHTAYSEKTSSYERIDLFIQKALVNTAD